VACIFHHIETKESATNYFIVFLLSAMGKSRFKFHPFISLLFFSVITFTSMAQEGSPVYSFPKDFTGNWKGSLNWFPAGKEMQKVNMQLIVQPEAGTSQYSWQLIYGDSAKDNRPYHLKAVDTARGHWVVDENDGILLDGYWIGNRFISMFSVQGSTITALYWLEGESLHVEMISTRSEAVRESGKGSSDVPAVQSFPVRSYQKAILYKAQ
jgi:hypothetical protein